MRYIAVYVSLFLTSILSYLGPFVFTRTLLPLLESTAANGDDVRIVNVGLLVYVSHVHWALRFRLDPQVMRTLLSWIMAQRKLGIISSAGPYSRRCHDTVSPTAWIYYTLLMSAKEYSKLAVHLWTNNLAKRLTAENSKVMVLLAHPGAILSVSLLHSTLHRSSIFFYFFLLGWRHPQSENPAFPTFLDMALRDNDVPTGRGRIHIGVCRLYFTRQPRDLPWCIHLPT